MTNFFLSDNHFNHLLMAQVRGFESIEAMNEHMIERWNSVVGDTDRVFHLGDFALGQKEHISGIRQRLKGRITLIRGNHDRSVSAMKSFGFDEVHNTLITALENRIIYMRHYPVKDIPFDVNIALCGHVHTLWTKNDKGVINCSVEQHDYTPQTLEQLLNKTKDL